VKERHAEEERNRYHSTKTAQQAADVDGVIKGMKKMRAKRDQRYDHSKYLREHGAELLRGGRVEVDGDCCDNCRRKNFSSDPRYALEFEVALNTEIRANTLAKAKPKNRHTPVMEYSLCQECVRFLKKPDNFAVMTACQKDRMLDWKNTWPSFMWDLLSSPHNWREHPKKQWGMICASMRPYWVNAIGTIKKNEAFIYTGCDLQIPEPYFVDRILDVDKHQANIDCYHLKSMIAELNSVKPSLIPDVVCPWGCTEFCFQGKHFHLGLIIQHQLRKVVLKFPRSKWYEKLHLVESSHKD